MGIICCLYSSACLLEFLLGVIDFGNSELNAVLRASAGAEAEGCPPEASSKVLAASGTAGGGYGGGGAVTELMYFLPLSFLPLVLKVRGVRGLHGSTPVCVTGAGLL